VSANAFSRAQAVVSVGYREGIGEMGCRGIKQSHGRGRSGARELADQMRIALGEAEGKVRSMKARRPRKASDRKYEHYWHEMQPIKGKEGNGGARMSEMEKAKKKVQCGGRAMPRR